MTKIQKLVPDETKQLENLREFTITINKGNLHPIRADYAIDAFIRLGFLIDKVFSLGSGIIFNNFIIVFCLLINILVDIKVYWSVGL